MCRCTSRRRMMFPNRCRRFTKCLTGGGNCLNIAFPFEKGGWGNEGGRKGRVGSVFDTCVKSTLVSCCSVRFFIRTLPSRTNCRHVKIKVLVDPDCIIEWTPQEVWLVWILFPNNCPMLLEINEQVLKVLVQDQLLAFGSCPTLIVASVTVGVKCTLAREYRTLHHLHLQSFQLADQ